MGEQLPPMFQELLRRTDGWTENVNESSLDYDFIKRHPQMSVIFLSFTGIAVAAGNIGNVLVSSLSLSLSLCLFPSASLDYSQSSFKPEALFYIIVGSRPFQQHCDRFRPMYDYAEIMKGG